MKSTTWPQLCAAARVQLMRPRQDGDELAMLLASGILGMDREMTTTPGWPKTPEEELQPETIALFARG